MKYKILLTIVLIVLIFLSGCKYVEPCETKCNRVQSYNYCSGTYEYRYARYACTKEEERQMDELCFWICELE